MDEKDLLGLCAFFIGRKTPIYNEIDKIYESDVRKYLASSKKSDWYDCGIVLFQNAVEIKYIRRMLGILQVDEDSSLKILKKGWPFIYQKLNQGLDIELNEIVMEFLMKKKNLEETELYEVPELHTLILYFAKLMNTQIKHTVDKGIVEHQLGNMANTYKVKKELSKEFSKEEIAVKTKDVKELLLGNIKNDIRRKTITAPLKDPFRGSFNLFKIEHDKLECKNEEIQAIYDSVREILSYDHIMLEQELTSLKQFHDSVNHIIYIYMKYSKDINAANLRTYIPAVLAIKGIANLYNDLKKLYLDNSGDKYIIKNNQLMKELESFKTQNKELRKDKELIKKEYDLLKKEKVQGIDAEINSLKLIVKEQREKIAYQNKQLKSLTEENELQKEKIVYLENMINSFKVQEAALSCTEEIDESVQIIDIPMDVQKKCVICGGLPSSNRIISDNYRGIKFISINNYSYQMLDKIEYIFFNIVYNNHPIYKKLKNTAKRKNIKFIHVEGGAKQLIEKIYSIMVPEKS